MKSLQPSNTYKMLFNHIIGELLSQICERMPNYSVRNQKVFYELGDKFDEYRRRANGHMSRSRLDRHKLASCICGAIVEIQPIVCVTGGDAQKANSLFAICVGLNVIKFYMMYDLLNHLDASSDSKKRLKLYLRDHFDMQMPAIDENICDTQEYQTNLINALYWTHHKCEYKKKECYHYDIWAYAKIFYHLELYNKPRFESVFEEYRKNEKMEQGA